MLSLCLLQLIFLLDIEDLINKFDNVFLSEHFNVLWKANWTREAEKVLKTFEKDVIRKVRNRGYKTLSKQD